MNRRPFALRSTAGISKSKMIPHLIQEDGMSFHGELASLTRRDLVRMAAATGAVLGGGAASGVLGAGRAHAQTTLTPDDALKTLMDGNARFKAGQLTSFQEDLTLLAQKTAEKQEPFA